MSVNRRLQHSASLIALSGILAVSSFVTAVPAHANSARNTFASIGKLGRYTRKPNLPVDVRVPAGTRATQATSVTFTVGDSWPSNTQQGRDIRNVIANYIRVIQPVVTNVYGDPSPTQNGKVVTIESGVGGYSPPKDSSATGGVIRIQLTGTDAATIQIFKAQFVPLMLAAYHGRAMFNVKYTDDELRLVEPWEFGFQDAAAMHVLSQELGASTFDPAQYSYAYCMPMYDYWNRPGIGNLTYSAGTLPIADLRAALAQSGWLKVAAENTSFFKNFNEKYYTAFTADRSAAGNLDTLRGIAAQVVPTVEGQSFQDWFRRQYGLDASVTTGEKLISAVSPARQGGLSDGVTVGRMGLFVEHFITAPDGSETPLGGIGSLAVFDENGTDVSAKSPTLTSSNTYQIDTTGSLPGEFFGVFDFSGVGTPDKALLTNKIRVGALETNSFFPYAVTGTNTTTVGYCGGIQGAKTGTMTTRVNAGTAMSIAVTKATFQQSFAYPSGPSVKTTFSLGGKTVTRNTAWHVNQSDSTFRLITFLLDLSSTSGTVSMTIPAGSSTRRMISIPVIPNSGDEAEVLGADKSTLALARYRSTLSQQPVGEGTLPYGITGDRHELYPNISTPMIPGRGYWLGVTGGSTRNVSGAEPSKDTSYEVPLSGSWAPVNASDLSKGWVETGGWNQIGVPYNRVYAADAILVRYGGFAPVPWTTAVSRGWVGAGIWRWLPAGGYEDISRTGTKLQPFEGYYVYTPVAHGVYLVFDPSRAATAVAQPAGWRVSLTAATNTQQDRTNSLGVSALRVPAAKPPAGPRVVTLRFLSGGSESSDASGAGAASGWADSYLPTLDKTGQWTFVVDGAVDGQKVTLSWPDLSGLPSDVKLRLIDTVNSTATAMTSGRTYAFTSKGITRKFRVEATRMALPTLTVTTAPSTGYKIVLSSNVAFSGRLEVRTDGVVVRTIATGNFNAGKTNFTWDGKNAAGKKVPPGTYRFWIIPEEGTGTESRVVVQIP